MHVPTHDHTVLYRRYKPALDAAVVRVLASGQLDWGPEVPAFEDDFARWLGATHAVGTNSGTAALKVALLALGVGPGDEVITVPNSDIGSTAAIRHVGATVVWVDVEPDTGNIDPALVAAAVTPRTAAILPVDLYGHPADLPTLRTIAERHGLAIVEDACLALGAAIDGCPVGQWADITCFSFAPTKHLGAYGSAGAAVTNDSALALRMQRLVGYGQNREQHYGGSLAAAPLEHLCEGLNERLDELQAAMLQVKLPHLREIINGYIARAGVYTDSLVDAAVRNGAMTGFAFPDVLVRVYEHFVAGRDGEAEDLFDAYLPLNRYEQQPGFGLGVRKEILRRRGGLPCAAARYPAFTMGVREYAELDGLMARAAQRDAAG